MWHAGVRLDLLDDATRWWWLAVRRVHPAAVLAFEHGMSGKQNPVFEYPHLEGMVLNLDPALFRRVGHRVEITRDRDHALVADAALDGEHSVIGFGRQCYQRGLLFGKGLVDHPVGGGMNPGIGNVQCASDRTAH